jgi:hypothetical protein
LIQSVLSQLNFSFYRHQPIVADFSGGQITSDAGLLPLRAFDQRFANNGNQFSVEPPDQGLCAGNGFVLESVNDVLKVFDTSGTTMLGTVDLNTFYHYPPAIDRQHGNARGPSITDPTCYYDAPTGRWFQLVLTLDQTPAGALLGTDHEPSPVCD